MRSRSVLSIATWSASALAESSTSAAAAGSASASARRSALPVLLGITALPLLRLLPGKAPGLQVLLVGPERVEQPLRLRAVHRLLGGLGLFLVVGARSLLLAGLLLRGLLLLLLLLVPRLLLRVRFLLSA